MARGDLTPKVITNKKGHQQTVYVRPDASNPQAGRVAGNAPVPSVMSSSTSKVLDVKDLTERQAANLDDYATGSVKLGDDFKDGDHIVHEGDIYRISEDGDDEGNVIWVGQSVRDPEHREVIYGDPMVYYGVPNDPTLLAGEDRQYAVASALERPGQEQMVTTTIEALQTDLSAGEWAELRESIAADTERDFARGLARCVLDVGHGSPREVGEKARDIINSIRMTVHHR